jgi:hypothetical protein
MVVNMGDWLSRRRMCRYRIPVIRTKGDFGRRKTGGRGKPPEKAAAGRIACPTQADEVFGGYGSWKVEDWIWQVSGKEPERISIW